MLYCLNWYSTRYLISIKLEKKEIGKKKRNAWFFSFWIFFLPLGRIVNSTVILYRCSSANNHVFTYILLLNFILEKQHPSFLLHVSSASHTECFTSDTSGHQICVGVFPTPRQILCNASQMSFGSSDTTDLEMVSDPSLTRAQSHKTAPALLHILITTWVPSYQLTWI